MRYSAFELQLQLGILRILAAKILQVLKKNKASEHTHTHINFIGIYPLNTKT